MSVMISCISIIQDSHYLRGTGEGLAVDVEELIFLRNMCVAIMSPFALKKDYKLEGEVGLSEKRTDTLKLEHRH
jgi:hypothetical protein